MYTADYGTVQLLYEDRLREAERKRRLLYLTMDMNSPASSESGHGWLRQIRQWLASRGQHQATGDVRRPRAI